MAYAGPVRPLTGRRDVVDAVPRTPRNKRTQVPTYHDRYRSQLSGTSMKPAEKNDAPLYHRMNKIEHLPSCVRTQSKQAVRYHAPQRGLDFEPTPRGGKECFSRLGPGLVSAQSGMKAVVTTADPKQEPLTPRRGKQMSKGPRAELAYFYSGVSVNR